MDSALQYTREQDSTIHSADFVDAQRAIERSTKAIFELMDVQYPNEHAISPESQPGRNLLNAISEEIRNIDFPMQTAGHISEDEIEEEHVRAVARLLFLCEMHGRMYTLASYGIDEPDFQLPPNKLIEDPEYGFILDSAVSALRIADAVIDSVAMGELPRTDRASGPEGPMEWRSGIRSRHYGVGKHSTEYDPVSEYRRQF
jgi:hypothetical protein